MSKHDEFEAVGNTLVEDLFSCALILGLVLALGAAVASMFGIDVIKYVKLLLVGGMK